MGFARAGDCLSWLPILTCWWIGQGLYEVHPCTGTSDAVCDSCLNHQPQLENHAEQTSEADETQLVANADYRRQCGHNNNNNGPPPPPLHHQQHQEQQEQQLQQQQRNLLSTIADQHQHNQPHGGQKRTTSGHLIHFLSHAIKDASDDDSNSLVSTATVSSISENALPTGSFAITGLINTEEPHLLRAFTIHD